MKISEIIVVEGKNDVAAVKRAVNADCVSVSGLGINKQTIKFLKELDKKRGLIVLMDPDSPGEKIRSIISEQIPSSNHAFIKSKNARYKGDLGIENASPKTIQESLNHLISPRKIKSTITIDNLVDLNLISAPNSAVLRDKLSDRLNLGKCNGKTLLKRLNMLGISIEELKLKMERLDEG